VFHPSGMRFKLSVLFLILLVLPGALCQTASRGQSGGALQHPATFSSPNGLIQHVFIIMQENRSFDNYFGTYPGANGIPMDTNGVPTVCVPDPLTAVCMRPYHSTSMVNFGGPHTNTASPTAYVIPLQRGSHPMLMRGRCARLWVGHRSVWR